MPVCVCRYSDIGDIGSLALMRMNIPWPFSDHLIILFVSLCAFLLSLFFVMVRYRLGLPEQFQILGALIRPSKPPLLMNRSCTVSVAKFWLRVTQISLI